MDNDTEPKTSSGQSWFYSSLLQIISPIKILTTKLGTLTNVYSAASRYQYSEEDNKRFADIWKEKDVDVVFFSLHVIAQNDNDDARIKQIGVSKWRSDHGTQILSLQAQVEDDAIVEKSSLPQLVTSGFIFGETELISESDVGPWLECTIRALRGSQQPTYLVGHDISHMLHLVQPYWKVPDDVTILDVRAIWESENRGASNPSLNQMSRMIGYGWDEPILSNAGNCAQLIMELLKSEGTRRELKTNGSRYMNMGMNMWRSPSW